MAYPQRPAASSSALDFCEIIGAKQRGLDGMLAVALEKDEQTTLTSLLSDYNQNGSSAALEARARRFLFIYSERESHSPVLTKDERTQLDAILAPAPQPPQVKSTFPTRPSFNWHQLRLRPAVVAIVIAVCVGGVFGVRAIVNSWQGGPQAGVAQQHPPAQNVAPSNTDLQSLKQAYGPFQQLTPSDQQPQTGQPAVLLLEGGGYFASTKWTVSTNASGWQQDIVGDVNNVQVNGQHADITDADGTPYIVGIDQPFIVSSNPGTMLRIDPTGNVLSITMAQANLQRQSLSK